MQHLIQYVHLTLDPSRRRIATMTTTTGPAHLRLVSPASFIIPCKRTEKSSLHTGEQQQSWILPDLMIEMVNSSQGGNSATARPASSMAECSFLSTTAMSSSGRRTTSGARKLRSGTERETVTGMVDGEGRYSVRYLRRRVRRRLGSRAMKPEVYFF